MSREETAAQRRGRLNRSRGNAIERWVCQALGIKRVGMFGNKTDGGDRDDWIVVQVKSGQSFPTRIQTLLESIQTRGGQLRAVVHVTATGSGVAKKALISMSLEEFLAWQSSFASGSFSEESTDSTMETLG